MEKTIKENHWRKIDGSNYGFCEACVGVDTGYHFCCNTSEKTDLERMGVGISLYFRFLKYLGGFFFLFIIFSIPSIFFSIEGKNLIFQKFICVKS
jgi:hypothetical protein